MIKFIPWVEIKKVGKNLSCSVRRSKTIERGKIRGGQWGWRGGEKKATTLE